MSAPFAARAAVLLSLAAFAACEQSAPVAEKPPPPPKLEAVTVEPRLTPVEREFDGTIEAVNQSTVAAQTSGRVAEILYDVNDFVPAGTVIVRLRATEQRAGLLEAEAALREAEAREAEAQEQFRRMEEMYERKVAPKATYDQARANRDAAVAKLSAARAALERAREGVAYTEIRAPYAGIVTRRHVEIGETVSPGTPIMSGFSLQYLRVTVDVPQSAVEQIRRIKKAAVYVGDRRIEAMSLTIFPEASSPSNTFRTRVELPENAADLYPGMYVKVGFVVGELERLLVPLSAVIVRSEVTAVYVITPDGRVSMRHVRPGRRFGDEVEVLAGLQAGERVAVDSLAALKYLQSKAPARGGGDE